jgi:Na+/H+-dicarboxylate symporter
LFFSILVCDAGLGRLELKKNGEMGVMTFTLFLATSFFNVALGIGLVHLIGPGLSANQDPPVDTVQPTGDTDRAPPSLQLVDTFLDIGRYNYYSSFQNQRWILVPHLNHLLELLKFHCFKPYFIFVSPYGVEHFAELF